MLRPEFDAICAEFLKGCTQICNTKGTEYSGNTDCLSNFKRHAVSLDLKPTTILMVYMAKHWDSITTFVRKLEKAPITAVESNLSEPIGARLQDLVNYALLLNGLLEEERRAVHKT